MEKRAGGLNHIDSEGDGLTGQLGRPPRAVNAGKN